MTKAIKPGDIVSIRVHWGGFLPDTRYDVKVISIDRLFRVTCYERMWSGGITWCVPIKNVIQ